MAWGLFRTILAGIAPHRAKPRPGTGRGQNVDGVRASDRDGMVLTLLALVSAVFLCGPMFSDVPLALDEHVSYWALDSEQPSTISARSLEQMATPPLASWTQAVSLRVLGKSETALRLPSTIAFWVAIIVIAGCGRSSGQPLAGGLAAILLAWHPTVLDEVRIARCYGHVVLFSAICLLAVLKWRARPRSVVGGLLFALAATAIAWTHYVAILCPLVLGIAMLLAPARDGTASASRRPPLWLIGLVALVVCLLCGRLIPAVLRLSDWAPFLDFQSVAPDPLAIVGNLWVAGCPVIIVIAALGAMLSRRPQTAFPSEKRLAPADWTFLALVTLAPIGLFLILIWTGPASLAANPRYRVAFAVPAALFIAQIVCRLTRDSLWIASVAVAIGVAGIWLAEGRSPWDPIRIGGAADRDWKQIARIVDRNGHPGDPVLVQSGLVEAALVPGLFEDELFLDYVACRLGRFYLADRHPRWAIPYFWDHNPEIGSFYREKLAGAAGESNRSVWVAAAIDTDLNRNSLAGTEQLLQANGWQRVGIHEFADAVLQQYERLDESAAD